MIVDPDTDIIDVDILLVEDSEPDIALAVLRLTHGGFRCRYRVAETEAALRNALRERAPSFILSDFSLPRFDGMSALLIANEMAPDVPSSFCPARWARSAPSKLCGVAPSTTCLKSNPMRLVPAVKRALAEAQLRRATREAERRVARLSGVLQMLSEINTAVVRIQDREALLQEACRLAHRLGGYPLAVIATTDPATRRRGQSPPRACWPRACLPTCSH